jgi:hypothetical protein
MSPAAQAAQVFEGSEVSVAVEQRVVVFDAERRHEHID